MKQGIITSFLAEINNYINQGNDAIKHGNEDESISWYHKALALAIREKDQSKEDEISGLLITMI